MTVRANLLAILLGCGLGASVNGATCSVLESSVDDTWISDWDTVSVSENQGVDSWTPGVHIVEEYLDGGVGYYSRSLQGNHTLVWKWKILWQPGSGGSRRPPVTSTVSLSARQQLLVSGEIWSSEYLQSSSFSLSGTSYGQLADASGSYNSPPWEDSDSEGVNNLLGVPGPWTYTPTQEMQTTVTWQLVNGQWVAEATALDLSTFSTGQYSWTESEFEGGVAGGWGLFALTKQIRLTKVDGQVVSTW